MPLQPTETSTAIWVSQKRWMLSELEFLQKTLRAPREGIFDKPLVASDDAQKPVQRNRGSIRVVNFSPCDQTALAQNEHVMIYAHKDGGLHRLR